MGAQDAADAEAVLNQLMRTGANVAPPTGGEEASSAEFFEEIRKLLADFNVSIQEESKDRKLRFHVKRLIKSHQQRGEDVDEELDFYMDDDDGDLACLSHRHIRRASSSLPLLFLFAVAVLFTMEAVSYTHLRAHET